ncbi:MAG: membrane-bound lytic murein transglycosylase MltF [Parvibaculum sp.]
MKRAGVLVHRFIRWLLPPWADRRVPYVVMLLLLLFGAESLRPYMPPVPQGLDAIRNSGKLVLLIRQSPASYYQGTLGPTGFDYELGRAIAKSLGVEPEFRIFDTESEMLEALAARKGQAAVGLAQSPQRLARFASGAGYETVRQLVICRRDGAMPKKIEDLAGLKVAVSAGSAAEEALASANAQGLNIAHRALPPETLMQQVTDGALDCTLADALLFRITNPYYPELVQAFALTGDQQIGWLLASGSEDLREYLRTWFAGARKSGIFSSIERRFYGFLPPFDYVDSRAFKLAIQKVLPDYEKAFRRAARNTGLTWQLIAAIAYQESHWNPNAKSATGVRGIMMLTEDTARALGVTNRLDPGESIEAGARYIADLIAKMPEDIPQAERPWFALATYNMGLAHLYDARVLAARMGLNRNSWTDMRRILPLLQRSEYAATLKSGGAPGGQAVRFVQQVRTYQHILEAGN